MARYATFTALPLEIIVEILKELDWQSLLKIRLVRLPYFFHLYSKAHVVVRLANLLILSREFVTNTINT